MRFSFRLLLALLSCPLASSVTFASEVQGSVSLANGTPARNAVVWLEGAFKGKPLKNAVIDQRDLMFIPHISVITVGTTVRFPNDDTVYHNVFAEFEAKRFDFGMYPRGTSKSKLFDKPGVVALMCSVHSNMSAFIMVVDTPFYALTDRNGKFKISNAGDGNYKLRAWHESNQSYQANVRIGSDTTSLNLKMGRH